jgi:hypothetical protein
MRIGDVRYTASIDDESGKIEFTELVLRTMQMRDKFHGIKWINGPKMVCYWVVKEKGLTWVKLSKSHFDWGWAKSIPSYLRRDHLVDNAPPGRPSKKGALLKLLADQRKSLKFHGDEIDPDYPNDLTYAAKIKKIQTSIKKQG